MKRNSIFIIIPVFLAVLFFTVKFYYKIEYYKDHILGFYFTLQEKASLKRDYTIINQEEYRDYVNLYRDLPRNLFHSGKMLLYKSDGRISLHKLALETIRYTDHYDLSDFKRDIKRFNGLNDNEIKKNKTLLIPNTLPSLAVNIKNSKRPKIIYTNGLYFSGHSAGSKGLLKKLPSFKRLGINAIVFDAKDVTGIVNYRSSTEGVRKYGTDEKRTIHNIEKLIRELKKNKIYTIARIAVFHDHQLFKKSPSLAIHSKRSGGVWNKGDKEKWCDPTNKEVQDYNIDLAVELAKLGVDEIQFDYIRFPTTGDLRDAKFKYDFGVMKKEEAIAHFLKRAYREIKANNTLLSIDIFGVVAWGKEVDIKKTGQRINMLAEHCDVISPMLYPSHFNDDFDGYKRPGDEPYYFIYEGCKKVMNLSGANVKIRPWLQAFKWRVSNYNKNYIIKQIKASVDSGAYGHLFWNASNDYDTVYRALESISKNDSDFKPISFDKNRLSDEAQYN